MKDEECQRAAGVTVPFVTLRGCYAIRERGRFAGCARSLGPLRALMPSVLRPHEVPVAQRSGREGLSKESCDRRKIS